MPDAVDEPLGRCLRQGRGVCNNYDLGIACSGDGEFN
jgi:hypothetical protein